MVMCSYTGRILMYNAMAAPCRAQYSQSERSRDTGMHVSIVGAGMGGLAAGIRLAAAGVQVTLFEQGERVSGKLNRWSASGWTFDTGPSLLTMPWVLRDLFTAAGRDL